MEKAVPSSTKYKNKWALLIFGEWQFAWTIKVPILDPGGLFKEYDLHKVATLSTGIEEMDVLSLNYWLSKFIMEVAKRDRREISCDNYLRNSLWSEKPSKEKITEVLSVLEPSTSATEVKVAEEKDLSCLTSSDAQDVVSAGQLKSKCQ